MDGKARYTAEIMPSAAKALSKLPFTLRGRIGAAIDKLEIAPRPAGCEKLSGQEDTYRIRIGDYRVLYDIYDDRLVVLVIRIAHRREAYR